MQTGCVVSPGSTCAQVWWRAGDKASQVWRRTDTPGKLTPVLRKSSSEPPTPVRLQAHQGGPTLCPQPSEEISASRRGQSTITKTKHTRKLQRSAKQEPQLCTQVSTSAHFPRFPRPATTGLPEGVSVEHQLREALCRNGIRVARKSERAPTALVW